MSGDRDYVTLYVADGPRANKKFTRLADGSVLKEPAVEGGSYVAETLHCPDAPSLMALYQDIGSDPRQVVSFGFFPEAPESRFAVWPRKRIARAIGLDPAAMSKLELVERTQGFFAITGEPLPVASRTRNNTILSSWILLDRDFVLDMPPELANLDLAGWLAEMARLLPTLDTAVQILVPSSSRRVLVDGKPYSEKAAWHLLTQVSDPDDLRNRVWSQMLIKAFALKLTGTETPLGFMRSKLAKDGSGRVTGRQAWSAYDPTVLWSERLIFDGAPALEGKGLTLAPVDVQLLQIGGRVDVQAFADLTGAQQKPAAAQGIRLERRQERARQRGTSGGGRERVSVVFPTMRILRPELELEVEHGTSTVKALWLANAGHERCQAPYRESRSWAAYFNQHEGDGFPFVHDSGADTKYTLDPNAPLPDPAEFIATLEAALALADGKAETPAEIRYMTDFARNIAGIAAKLGWESLAIDALMEKLATILAGPLGQARSTLARSLRKRGREAAAVSRAMAAEAPDVAVQDEAIAELNRQFAVVNLQGSVRIVEPEAWDPNLGRTYVRVMGDRDFSLQYRNRTVMLRDGKEIPLAVWWSGHPERRQYLGGVTLDPTNTHGPEYLNAWQGFGVDPVPGDCQVLLDHVAFVASKSGPVAQEYLLRWLARKVQLPAAQAETAVVMRGTEGVGKGALGHAMRRLFGKHGMHISNPEHLVGRFNQHLATCCLLFADEAFFAGDKKHASVLKALITEDVLTVEPKYVNAYQVPNHLGLMMASNLDYVVPAGKDARRYFCVDVPDEHHGDKAYFDRLFAAITDPQQLGAFLYHLLQIDLAGFDIRRVPTTAMLADQKVASFDPAERWWCNRLHVGSFPGRYVTVNGKTTAITGWPEWMSTTELYESYLTELRLNANARYALDRVRFGQFMSRYYRRRRSLVAGEQTPGYAIGQGGLDVARMIFAQHHGLTEDMAPWDGWGTWDQAADRGLDIRVVRGGKP